MMVAESWTRRPAWRQAVLGLAFAAAFGTHATMAKAQDFSEILAAPDDESLNLAYAREQARLGNLGLASSTLERLLIMDPNRHSVRLFHGVVLYRLGDMQGARDELRRLDAVPLSPVVR